MKSKLLVATLSLLIVAGSAVAEDAVTHDAPAGRTRAEVVAELVQSKADGSYAALHSEFEYMDHTGFKSTKSRSDVTAEYHRAVSDGSYERRNREAVDPAEGFVSTRTRADVTRHMEKAFADPAFRAAQAELYRG